MMKRALFIDGANLWATAKALGFDTDFKRVLRKFNSDGCLLRAFYYTAVPEPDAQGNVSIQPLVDYLSYNGYHVVTKATKEYRDPNTNLTRIKGNMDIEIAVDMFKMSKIVDEMILFTGDGDFRKLVEVVQEAGVKVHVVSSTLTRPSPMVANELRRQADTFIEIDSIKDELRQIPDGERPNPRIEALKRRAQ